MGQIGFKTDLPSHAAVAKKILLWILPFYGFCTFGSGIPELCCARRSPALVVMVRGMPVVGSSLHNNFWIPEIIGCVLCVLLMVHPVHHPAVLGLPHSWIQTGLFGYCIFVMLEMQL